MRTNDFKDRTRQRLEVHAGLRLALPCGGVSGPCSLSASGIPGELFRAPQPPCPSHIERRLNHARMQRKVRAGLSIGFIAEILLPLLCGVFFLETVSVIIQTSYFKYTRRKTGTGRRIFRMAPLHHHYEAQGIPESKIVIRFWIVTAILVISTLLTFRIR